MTRNLSAGFQTQKNAEASRPIVLYEIEIDGSTTLYLAAYDVDVVFDGQTYTSFGAKHEDIKGSWEDLNPQVTVALANVDQTFSDYLATKDLRGNKLIIKIVFADALGDSANYLEDVNYIDHIQVTRIQVTFFLAGKLNILKMKVPGRLYLKNMCAWIYKGTECGYTGGLTSCDKTLNGGNGCAAHNNTARYGGFPNIPGNKPFFR